MSPAAPPPTGAAAAPAGQEPERRVFRFHGGRLVRNLLALLPLAGFPAALALSGRFDPVITALFGAGVLGAVGAVVYSAVRFRLVIDAEGLDVRGRFHRRRVRWADVNGLKVRRGRDKPMHFMGPPPYRELVLITDHRKLVISSLPLGEEAFDEVVRLAAARIPVPPP